MIDGGQHGFDVIDGHTHVGDMTSSVGGLVAPGSGQAHEKTEVEHRLARLDEQSVRQAVVIAGHAYLRPNGLADTMRINDGIAAYRDADPERFPVAVGVVEPLYGAAGLPEITRTQQELGLAGISFHTRFQGVHLDSSWVYRYLEAMGECSLVPFVHVIGGVPEEALWQLERLAQSFPDLTFLALDAFMHPETARELVYVGERCPNILFDTALAVSVPLFLEPAFERLGSSRFFYGTDIYSWPLTRRPFTILPQILEVEMPDSDKAAILGGNLRAVLGLPSAQGAGI